MANAYKRYYSSLRTCRISWYSIRQPWVAVTPSRSISVVHFLDQLAVSCLPSAWQYPVLVLSMVVFLLSQPFHRLFRVKRRDVHECTAHPSRRTRRIPPRYVWQTEQIAKDTGECHPVANGNDDRIHRHWGWVPISGQLFGGGILVLLLFDCTS